MGHFHSHHGHHHCHHHHGSSSKNIATAFFLNLAFTIVELIGGIFTNSLAILSDALHDLGDSLSLGLAWYFEKKATKKPTKIYSYGFRRLSLLGAIINSVILIVGSIIIIIEAIPRLLAPEETNANVMMWLALLGIIVNGAAVLKLKKGTSINERVVSLHLLEDVLGWVAVLIASICMQFWDIPHLDSILSILISVFVLINVYKNIKVSLRIVLQGIPMGVSIDNVEQEILKKTAIKNIYDSHLWTMDGDYNVFTARIVMKKNHNLNEVEVLKKQLKEELHTKFCLEHITIEFEPSEELLECVESN